MIVVSPSRSSLRYGALLYLMIHQSHFLRFWHQCHNTRTKTLLPGQSKPLQTQRTPRKHSRRIQMCYFYVLWSHLNFSPVPGTIKEYLYFLHFLFFLWSHQKFSPVPATIKELLKLPSKLSYLFKSLQALSMYFIFFVFCVLYFIVLLTIQGLAYNSIQTS